MSYVTELIDKELKGYYYDNIFVEGDLSIAISYFDDFYLFDLMEEKDGEDVPIDLSNITEVNLVFFDSSKTVTIPRMKNAADINPAQGQVMFKISEKDSATILGLENNNFYITLVSGTGKEKDEVSILKAKFYSLENFNQMIIDRQKLNIDSAISQRITTLSNERNALSDSISSLDGENSVLKEDYNDLYAAYAELEKKYKESIAKLKNVPSTLNSSFTPENAVNVNPDNVAVADLPATQTPPISQQDKKSTKEKELDLESNNQLVMIPTGGSSDSGTLPAESNPFSNYSGSN